MSTEGEDYQAQKPTEIVYYDPHKAARIFWSTILLVYVTPLLSISYIVEIAVSGLHEHKNCVVDYKSGDVVKGDWSKPEELREQLDKNGDHYNVADSCYKLIVAAIVFHSLLVIPLAFVVYGEQKQNWKVRTIGFSLYALSILISMINAV